jgi:hypothetical protein
MTNKKNTPKREHPYGKGPFFLEKFEQKKIKKIEKVFRGFLCYPYIEQNG